MPTLPSLEHQRSLATNVLPPLRSHHEERAFARSRPAKDAPKTRKPSYLAQREEREELADQVRQLEEQLERLRCAAGLPSRADKAAIAHVEARNFDIEEKLHVNDLFLARLHSMVTRELQTPRVNPMSTFIHLPVDMAQRRKILRDMQELKLRRAEQMAFERLHHLDHSQPYVSEERFTTPNGEYHCDRMVLEPFPNFRSARELFDYFVHFLLNLEISVTEHLGQLTIREDQEDLDSHESSTAPTTIWNHRIVTTADNVGCTEELNVVAFARFYDEASGRPGAPYGIITYDTVNVDDLYPYRPLERTCKDNQSVNLVCEVRRPDANEPVVVLKQCLFTVQLPPQFPLAADKLQQLQDNCSVWSVAMLKYLHAYVAP